MRCIGPITSLILGLADAGCELNTTGPGGRPEAPTSTDASSTSSSGAPTSTTGVDETTTGSDETFVDGESTGDGTTTGSTTSGLDTGAGTDTGVGDTTGPACGEPAGDPCEAVVHARPDRFMINMETPEAINGDLLANDDVAAPAGGNVEQSAASAPLGDVVIGSNGALSYDAPVGGFGCDSFRYTVEADLCSDEAVGVVSLYREHVTTPELVAHGHALGIVDKFVPNIDGSYFGHTALSADFDGDGLDEAFVLGAFTYQGHHRLYSFATAALFELAKLDFNVTNVCDDGLCWDVLRPQADGWGMGLGHGDIDGDGRTDLVVASISGWSRFNVLYGDGITPQGSQNLAEFAAIHPTGAVKAAEYAEALGTHLHAGSDVNGDGFADILVAGVFPSAYVIFGGEQRLPADAVAHTTLVSNKQARKISLAAEQKFTAIHTAGDVDADGDDDILLGASGVEDSRGAAYVVLGESGAMAATAVDLTLGFDGFVLAGENAGDLFGASVAGGGDMNGDSFPDFVIGAPGFGGGLGAVYIVFGQEGGYSSSPSLVELLGADPPRAVRLATAKSSKFGARVALGGDFTGDGMDDLMIGAPALQSESGTVTPGMAYLLYGAPGLASGSVDALGGQDVLRISSLLNFSQQLPRAATLTGDHDGDGFSDLLVTMTPSGSLDNSAWIVRGGCMNGRVSYVGTPGDDTIDGDDTVEDVMVAGRGEDVFLRVGELDVAVGGPGDDSFEIVDTTYQRVAGGSGHDRMVLAGCDMTLDLTRDVPYDVAEIEEIDLGFGNHMIIDTAALGRISSTSNTLVISGDASSSVDVSGLVGFVAQVRGETTDIMSAGLTLVLRVQSDVQIQGL
jgi:hypothetical protein